MMKKIQVISRQPLSCILNWLALGLITIGVLFLMSCSFTKKSSNDSTDNLNANCSQGIVNGVPLDDNNILSKHVVLVRQHLNEKQDAACTGSLLKNNIVLTAAHCVSRDPELMTVTFSSFQSCASHRSLDLIRKVKFVILNEKYNSSHSGLSKQEELQNSRSDMALIKIEGEAPSDYVPFELPSKFFEMTLIKDITLIGYGRTNSLDESFPMLRSTSLPTDNLIEYKNEEPLIQINQKTAGVCMGDSGGPLIITDQNEFKTIGIASLVMRDNLDVDICSGSSVYVNLGYAPNLKWIRDNYSKINDQVSRPTENEVR